MTHENRDRPQGIFGRFRNLVRALFTGWIRDSEIQNPRAVYEQAISVRASFGVLRIWPGIGAAPLDG